MFSTTEERLRAFVEKLAESITMDELVEVRPGDSWAAYPGRKPPLLTYRLGDAAAIGDEIISVTAHEIAHLLYTTPVPQVNWKFDTGKYPRAAQLLLNAVEDSRIERVFSDTYPGARSLFDRKQEVAYDGKVQRGFDDLPAKWRFILNIDRVLHGLEPWGDQIDVDAVEAALDACLRGMWADDTQGCADELELPFRIMIQLIKREKQGDEGLPVPPHLQIPPELMGLPADYMGNFPQDDSHDRNGQVSDHAFDQGAQQDDHQVGGADGTDGKREQADGGGSGQGNVGIGEGAKAGSAESGAGKGGGQKGGAVGNFGDANDDDLPGDTAPVDGDTQGKSTNIIEEMVAEEKARGSTNKTIDILSYRQRQRAKEAKEIDQKIAQETKQNWDELMKVFGREKGDQYFVDRMKANVEQYNKDRAELETEIATLRRYARTVLRDNDTQRYGGNHKTGRRIKTHRLYRMETDDPRLMERKEEIGGRSYSVAVVVDQSSSMRAGQKSELAYRSALVFLEAFDGYVDTTAIGFSDIMKTDVGGIAMGDRRGYGGYYSYGRKPRASVMRNMTEEEWHRLQVARTYKNPNNDLKLFKAMVPELSRTYASTPMEAGMLEAINALEKSDKEVRAIVLITDGEPNDALAAEHEFKRARRLGIETYALFIGGRKQSTGTTTPHALIWLGQNADRVVEVKTTSMIPQAVNRLLRGVVRRRRYAVA